jgi:hypothetical protein
VKRIIGLLIFAVTPFTTARAQSTIEHSADPVGKEIIALEQAWNRDIRSHDRTLVEKYLAEGYFLTVGRQGRPLGMVTRNYWLRNLSSYIVESSNIDDIAVHVYGNTAVVVMLYTQKATVGPQQVDRSGQFFITDIWVKQDDTWRVAERHSVLAEPPSPEPAQK